MHWNDSIGANGSSDPLHSVVGLPLSVLVVITGRTLHSFVKLKGSEVADLVEHGIRTANIAVAVGRALDIPEGTIADIATAGRLHDIGKTKIDADILNKPGPLDAEEWIELRRHPQIGYDILRGRVDSSIAEMVVMHHERLDGHGYPSGLSAGSIDMPLRVLHVADAFDAITSHRPYQPAMPVTHAVSELTTNVGTQFDGDVVNALITLVGELSIESTTSVLTDERFAAVG